MSDDVRDFCNALHQQIREKDAEIERLKAELKECRNCLIREGMERDEARKAARTVLRDFNSYSVSKHVQHNYRLEWPWLEESSGD